MGQTFVKKTPHRQMGRNHLDRGSVSSPFRETESMTPAIPQPAPSQKNRRQNPQAIA
jgi:hypothetical protein